MWAAGWLKIADPCKGRLDANAGLSAAHSQHGCRVSKLAFHDVSLTIGGHEILRDLSFALAPGSWTFLIGPPGAGKTMLLRLAAGQLAPTSGTVARPGAAALVLHNAPLDDTKSAQANVAAAMAPAPDSDVRARTLLGDLGLDAYLAHEPFRLSRGYRGRLAIACAIAAAPAVLCLDDPFSPMDRSARARTADVLRRAAEEAGLAILMLSNDPLDALRHADAIMTMTPGPTARIAAIHACTPTPDASDDDLAAMPLAAMLEATLWDETPS